MEIILTDKEVEDILSVMSLTDLKEKLNESEESDYQWWEIEKKDNCFCLKEVEEKKRG